jgi:cell division protein FtsB
MINRSFQWYLMAGVVVLSVTMVLTDESRENLNTLKENLSYQKQKNIALSQHVSSLRSKIYRLANDDRYLEKVVRSELGLSGANEVVVLFDNPEKDNGVK